MKFVFLLAIWLVRAAIELNRNLGLDNVENAYQQFESSLKIYNEEYSIQCDCSDMAVKEIEEAKCHPTKIKLSQDKDGQGASYEEISDKLSIANFTYARTDKNSFSCLDGRITRGVLGTPGGDAGEFILGLLVYEDLSGKNLEQDMVDNYLEEYLRLMDSEDFYMCTDDYAIAHIERQLSVQGLDIKHPRDTLIADLLEIISDPNNIGDSHIRMMLEYPELYSIRPKAIELFIKSYYKIM